MREDELANRIKLFSKVAVEQDWKMGDGPRQKMACSVRQALLTAGLGSRNWI
jgi:hypothetical protein